jgi:glucose-6-phosphate 1-epimerase
LTLDQLTEQFAIPGVLTFHETSNGLIYAEVSMPQATATIYLHGAHLTAWQPTGHKPVIFLSRKSEFAAGKAIRGGVPIVCPWFGPRHDGKAGPSHGFARTQPWDLAFAALAGDALHLTFTLGATEMSRGLGYDRFRLVYEVIVGSELTLRLSVANDSDTPLLFEEALHAYFAVGDVRESSVDGLDGVSYLDKMDNLQEKTQMGPVALIAPTDRVYKDTASTCIVRDVENLRSITIAKTGSNTTVVWNPWDSGAAKLADMDAEEWREFLCVETANTAPNAIALAPGSMHSMEVRVSVEAGD